MKHMLLAACIAILGMSAANAASLWKCLPDTSGPDPFELLVNGTTITAFNVDGVQLWRNTFRVMRLTLDEGHANTWMLAVDDKTTFALAHYYNADYEHYGTKFIVLVEGRSITWTCK